MVDIRKSKTPCPKCRSKNINIHEIWRGHTISWHIENGTVNRNEGYLEPGDPYKVEGECRDCDHRWTFRMAADIEDVLIKAKKDATERTDSKA